MDRRVLKHAVFIAGPTSVGKSSLAMDYATRCGGEIVCADAFQLYRDFPMLSAQPTEADHRAVPHHLFGSVPCYEESDAARFAQLALEKIEEISQRGRVAIVVGGSGLYMQSLISGLPCLPTIDAELREKIRGMSLSEMLEQLQRVDSLSVEQIDSCNPRRVARRLEISLQAGRPASELLVPLVQPSDLRGMILVRDRDDLNERISRAVRDRLEGGAIDEVRCVRDQASTTARQILGWREIGELLDEKISYEECVERLIIATRQYAKRQLTWFRAKLTLPIVNLTTVTSETLDRTACEAGLL